jgi:hypothetical protein
MFGIKIISSKKFDEMEQTIREQRADIRELKIDLDEKNKEVSKLKSGISGEVVCDRYCEQCEHGIETDETYIYVGSGEYRKHKKYTCELSLPCKSFSRKK